MTFGWPTPTSDTSLAASAFSQTIRIYQLDSSSSSHFLIFYRHGGVAQGQCVLAFKIEPDQKIAEPVLVGCYLGSEPVESLAALREAFARNEVQQYRPTYLDF